ncbi:MAG: hypothetical protein C0429_08725 [Sphingopyxis sp.]|nr:hypothetical protein [Sphingopyxis sp.]
MANGTHVLSDQLQALRLLVQVARTGSFSRGAKDMRLSQPTFVATWFKSFVQSETRDRILSRLGTSTSAFVGPKAVGQLPARSA